MASALDSPMILVIDDSATIRKMVECHLSQAGYRVASVPDAERGLQLAESIRPHLILLDHQLPGTTGDDVCRRLLEAEATAHVPVVISSALRNRAFARYTDFPNVVDQIPKPFTPELLKSGVANALQTGAMVVQAQRTGCAMPEAVSEVAETTLEGHTGAFPLRQLVDFINNSQQSGRLVVESARDRYGFVLGGGRIQAVVSSTWTAERLERWLSGELADLAPLLALTLTERQDAPMSGLVRLLERSFSDPRRVRSLLRFQAGVLTYLAFHGEPGQFSFEPNSALPPMFQAFPLQASLPALLVEGVRRCEQPDVQGWGKLLFTRQLARGSNPDRAGLSGIELRIFSLLDGTQDLAHVAQAAGCELGAVVNVVRGLEYAGQAQRRVSGNLGSILVVEEDADTARVIQRALGPDGSGFDLKVVRDRVAAQLLLRRMKFDIVLLGLDGAEQEPFYRQCREQSKTSRFVGILGLDASSPLARIDALALDGVVHRPVSETDLKATVNHVLKA